MQNTRYIVTPYDVGAYTYKYTVHWEFFQQLQIETHLEKTMRADSIHQMRFYQTMSNRLSGNSFQTPSAPSTHWMVKYAPLRQL